MRLPSLVLLGALILGAIACSGDESSDYNNINVVTPTSPTGFVSGVVMNAIDGAALPDARVSLFGGELAQDTTTNERGEFKFGPISAGAEFSVQISADGFISATLAPVMIDDTAGNFPTANGARFVGPISLIPSTGTFEVLVVDEQGSPIPNARVDFRATPRFLDAAGEWEAHATATATSDVDGIAKVQGLPDLRRLSFSATLEIQAPPLDTNGDGRFELSGATLTLSGDALLNAGTPVLVLRAGGNAPITVIASNLGTLVDRTGAFPVISTNESITIAFNKAIERDSVVIDLRDELGSTPAIPAPFVLSASGNVLTIDPAEDLLQGREYNLTVSVASTRAGVRETFSASTPLFARVDINAAIAITGRFIDVNRNGAWGDGDSMELTSSIPIGRSRASNLRAELWVALDFNGTGVLGDSQGELPPSGQPYPAGLGVTLAEPTPGNGAGLSGFTRHFAPYPISIPTPLPNTGGGVAFEVRTVDAITDISGRPAPERTTGTALFQ
jgi:hypothetical protein